MFRGRAVEKLAEGLPLRPWQDLRECPYEELEAPVPGARRCLRPRSGLPGDQHREHVGNVPLSKIIANYRPEAHPVCGPLIRGGPAELARACGRTPAPGYIDECHLCFLTRKAAIEQYPQALAPRQVYGLE